MAEPDTQGLRVEQALAQLKEKFPNYARRVSITETALGATYTVVVGDQGISQPTLADCMKVVDRWYKALRAWKQEQG